MKSILIIETPNDCYDCPCYYEERNKCEATFKNVEDDDIEKPSWCPLRPLPQKIYAVYRGDYEYGVTDGWNACLDVITGETE